MNPETMKKLYASGDYFCFAKSSTTNWEWYLSEEHPLLVIPGIQYSLVSKEDIPTIESLGYKYKTKEAIEIFKKLGINTPEIEEI